MLSPEHVFSLLQEEGVAFFAGVPDSLLKSFCAYVMDHTGVQQHVITANEGNAVALAAGHFLGTGSPALVYMQNSGLGNAINPLLSLADKDVYSIPMLLMIGWRGEPGVKDEPQHVKQGRVMPELLSALDIPWFILDKETDDIRGVIADACATMRHESKPVALLVRDGAFMPCALRSVETMRFVMDREHAVKSVSGALGPDDLIVATTGKISRELYEHRKAAGHGHGNDFLTVGAMGHTSSIAMGLAQAQPLRRVVCLDGDGSVIMHMGALAVIGQARVPNLVHVLLNNGAHDSVGGQPTVALAIDLGGIALACGYRHVASVTDEESLQKALSELLGADGPSLLEIKVNKGARSDLGRPASTPVENRDALMATLMLRGRIAG
jgi:phosphonopyruvate decarboxylase